MNVIVEQFREGGWGMYPVTVFGLMLIWAAGRYARDLQPARLRFSVAAQASSIVLLMRQPSTAASAMPAHRRRLCSSRT